MLRSGFEMLDTEDSANASEPRFATVISDPIERALSGCVGDGNR